MKKKHKKAFHALEKRVKHLEERLDAAFPPQPPMVSGTSRSQENDEQIRSQGGN